MALKLYSGWDFSRVGQFKLEVSDNGGTSTITFSSGKYAHKDLSTVSGASEYVSFPSASQAALNTDSTLNGSYTVFFDSGSTTGNYVIQGPPSFSIDAGTNDVAKQTLGLSGSTFSETNNAISGNIQSYFYIQGEIGARSEITEDFEPRDRWVVNETDDGSHHAIGPTSLPTYTDFVIPFEPKEATFKRHATASIPWTWQHFWENVRGIEPFLITDDLEETVHYLRQESISFRAQIVETDFDDLWDLEFKCYVENPDRGESF